MANYPAGDVVVLSATFTSAGVASDPTTITLYVRNSAGLSTYVYGASPISRVSTGVYSMNFATTVSGDYFYRWVGTGAITAANESSFTAGPSNFV